MKSQTLQLIKGKSEKQILIAVGLLITAINTASTLPVNAQSMNQDSYLPPEVIPSNQAMTYGSVPINTSPKTPEISPVVQQAAQSPHEARQAIYNSLMGNNVYPQFNGQTSYNEANNAMNNLANPNVTNNQIQSFGQSAPQNFNNQMNSTNNYQANMSPPQTQTLSGSAQTQNTSQQRTTGGISHLAGVVAGFASSGVALATMRSPGGAYSAGLLGAGTMNYGLRNGFRF
jgi:hypothetical protein